MRLNLDLTLFDFSSDATCRSEFLLLSNISSTAAVFFVLLCKKFKHWSNHPWWHHCRCLTWRGSWHRSTQHPPTLEFLHTHDSRSSAGSPSMATRRLWPPRLLLKFVNSSELDHRPQLEREAEKKISDTQTRLWSFITFGFLFFVQLCANTQNFTFSSSLELKVSKYSQHVSCSFLFFFNKMEFFSLT